MKTPRPQAVNASIPELSSTNAETPLAPQSWIPAARRADPPPARTWRDREGARGMVMTMAKITAGDGYTYLTRHVANGDSGTEGRHAAAAYYTAQGNPPGRWIGRGAHLIGLEGQLVTEDHM